MSFTGSGLLGSFAWGTSAEQSLKQQQEEIQEKFTTVKGLIENGKSPQEESDVFAAGIFAEYPDEWDPKRKKQFNTKRRQNQSLPEEMRDSISNWQRKQLQYIQKRQQEIESLATSARRIVEATADLLSLLVIHLHLKEILLYPLVRDQISNGEAIFLRLLKHNGQLKNVLKAIKQRLTQDLKDEQWFSSFAAAEALWMQGLDREQQLLSPLYEYLKTAHFPTYEELHSLPAPEPKPNHDFNYGQQMSQMWEVLKIQYRKSGYFQGIPKPRQEPDWTLQDGFDPLPENSMGNFDKFSTTLDEPKMPTLHDVPTLKQVEKINHPHFDKYPPYGSVAQRLTKIQDAPSKEYRKELEELQKKEIQESQEGISQAHKVRGGRLVEKLENLPHNVVETVDKAKSYFRWLTSDKHTDDIEGSFNKHEVNLAFRNHGSHFEALQHDITPLGNHYLLIHFDVQYLNVKDYRLAIYGCVQNPSEWSLDDIKQLCPEAIVTQPITMECSGNGRTKMKPRFNGHVPWELQAFGTYVWTGLPLRVLLQAVGVAEDAVDVVFTGHDSGVQEQSIRFYQRALEIHDPVIDQTMIAWDNNGQGLLREHGFPLRVITPGWYGDNNVKWLKSIKIINHKFKGRHMVSYSYTKKQFDEDIAVPSQEIRPRSMVVPPGEPNFITRQRTVSSPGKVKLIGKAWVGGGYYRAITAVELSVDNGQTWKKAYLEPRLGIFAWHRWTVELDLEVGVFHFAVRATDSTGDRGKVNLGPEDWNWHGMCDDSCQTFTVVVAEHMTYTT